MASDFNKPVVTSTYTDYPGEIRENVNDVAKMFEGTSGSNIPTGAKQLENNRILKRYNGASWDTLGYLAEDASSAVAGDTETYYTANVATGDGSGSDGSNRKAIEDFLLNKDCSGKSYYFYHSDSTIKENDDSTWIDISLVNCSVTIDTSTTALTIEQLDLTHAYFKKKGASNITANNYINVVTNSTFVQENGAVTCNGYIDTTDYLGLVASRGSYIYVYDPTASFGDITVAYNAKVEISSDVRCSGTLLCSGAGSNNVNVENCSGLAATANIDIDGDVIVRTNSAMSSGSQMVIDGTLSLSNTSVVVSGSFMTLNDDTTLTYNCSLQSGGALTAGFLHARFNSSIDVSTTLTSNYLRLVYGCHLNCGFGTSSVTGFAGAEYSSTIESSGALNVTGNLDLIGNAIFNSGTASTCGGAIDANTGSIANNIT